MNRLPTFLAVLAGLTAAAVIYLYLILTGPDMRVQPALQTYDATMPVLPPDAVPAEPGVFFPSERRTETAGGQAPAPTMARGRFAYQAYCVFCHGKIGDGEAPVGQSYAPGPGDLRTDKVRAMDDAALLKASLTGTWHEPVLPRVVPPDDRPSLVLYVRALANGQLPPEEPAPEQ